MSDGTTNERELEAEQNAAGKAPEYDGGASDARRDAEIDETNAEAEQLQSDLNELQDRHLRLAAEFDNYRKRIDRERAESWNRAQADLVKRLLDALDDMQRVAHYNAERTTVQALLDGVQLVEKKLRQALESAGLEMIEARGQQFDPGSMEAVATTPAEHPEEDEVVADVFQPGYRFRNVLIRPARVRVKKYD